MTLVCGVDGCPDGWITVTHDLRSGAFGWSVVPSLLALMAPRGSPRVVALDIPIGLPDVGARECDMKARKLLGWPRACSVFPAPIRPMLGAATHAEASAAREEAEGKRVSIQAWAILPKIRDVDAVLRREPGIRSRVREVHPEVCFYFMAGGRPMRHSKKRRAGREERRRLLTRHFDREVDRVLGGVPRSGCGSDDVLDAFAALWTAIRIVRGQAVTVPENPGVDRFGLPMEMVA